MIISITTQDARDYTQQATLRAAVRSLSFTILHYDSDTILASVDEAPEIAHTILTQDETGLYLADAGVIHKDISVLCVSSSFALIQSSKPYPLLMSAIPRLTPLRMQGIRFR